MAITVNAIEARRILSNGGIVAGKYSDEIGSLTDIVFGSSNCVTEKELSKFDEFISSTDHLGWHPKPELGFEIVRGYVN